VLGSSDHGSEVWTSVELLPRIAAKTDSLERDAFMLPVAIVRREPDLSRYLRSDRRTMSADPEGGEVVMAHASDAVERGLGDGVRRLSTQARSEPRPASVCPLGWRAFGR